MNERLLLHAQEIITELNIKSIVGRPSIDFVRGLNGIYYLLRTGIIWQALPRCFGSYSAVHRLFQKLRAAGFFMKLWHKELQEYNVKHGLNLEVQVGDCSHTRAPLGREKTGKSPVDRRKLGTKRSIIVEKMVSSLVLRWVQEINMIQNYLRNQLNRFLDVFQIQDIKKCTWIAHTIQNIFALFCLIFTTYRKSAKIADLQNQKYHRKPKKNGGS
jgi:transposase